MSDSKTIVREVIIFTTITLIIIYTCYYYVFQVEKEPFIGYQSGISR